MVQIVPTILVKTRKEFEEKVRLLETDFPFAQIDVMDGKFVRNTTYFNIDEVGMTKTPMHYELHLMVEEPLNYIKKLWITNYENIIKVLFHCEAKSDIPKTIAEIRKLGCLAGLVINPETDITEVKNFLPSVDCVMLMGVHPGASGQEFIPETVEKVKALRALSPTISIEIDGGVNEKIAKLLVSAGADILAVGSFIYRGKPREQREKLLKSIE